MYRDMLPLFANNLQQKINKTIIYFLNIYFLKGSKHTQHWFSGVILKDDYLPQNIGIIPISSHEKII